MDAVSFCGLLIGDNMAVEAMARLTVFGRAFDPDKFTAMCKIAPTTVWRRGETTHALAALSRSSGWEISTMKRVTEFPNHAVDALLHRVRPEIDELVQAIKSLGLVVTVTLEVIVDDDPQPGFVLDPTVMRELAQLGARLEIDLQTSQKLLGPELRGE
jgi:hypothetical protein